MDSGWIAALASLGSTLIVAVTAIAAFRQLKHYRNANDIVVYLRLVDQMDSAATAEARAALSTMAQKVRTDPAYRYQLRDASLPNDDFRVIGPLLRFLEHISVLVIRGGVAEQLVLAEYAEMFVEIWDQVREAIIERRVALGPYTGRAFEHLAIRARRYIQSGQMAREYDALERDQSEATGPANVPS